MKPFLKMRLFPWGILIALVAFDLNAQQPFPIQAAVVQSNRVSFSFPTATGRLYLVESANEVGSYWTQDATFVGNGVTVSYTNAIAQRQQFFRIESRAQTNLTLFPSLPLLASNVVSLPDAVAGTAFLREISPQQSGFPPYQIQFSNTLPSGVTATVVSNTSAAAKIVLSSGGANLIAGERTQFAVWISDAQNVTVTQRYDLRVIAPAPTILTAQAELKAGVEANLTLEVTNAVAPFGWNLSGFLPEGITFGTNGTLSGTPTASAAEFNEDGLYFNSVQVLDSVTDRVTGQPRQRTTTTNIAARVRLSYALNINAARPNGPSLGTICTQCHGNGFPPRFDLPDATAIIYEGSGSGGECGTFQTYVWPGDMYNSLIWKKVQPEPIWCGNRMPATGDYLEPIQINRLARWINELTNDDAD